MNLLPITPRIPGSATWRAGIETIDDTLLGNYKELVRD